MLSFIDLFILGIFFLGMLYIGFKSKADIHNVKDFVVAGRSLPFGVVLATMVATGMGAGNLFGRSGYAYNAGAAMTMAMVGYFAAMVTASIFSKKMEKYNVLSIPELFSVMWGTEGNGRHARILAGVISFVYNATILGLQFVAFGTLFSLLGSPWGITPLMGAVIGAVITIVYTGLGGMFSVARTDVIQFIIMVTGVIIIGPLVAIHATGGYEPILESAKAAGISVWNPFTGRSGKEIFSLFLTGWMLNSVDPFVWQRIFSAKTYNIARKAIIVNGVICFMFAFGLTQMALAGRVLLPDLVASYGTTEAVLPALILTIFPVGIVGFMLAGALSTIMSSADSYLLQAGNALIYDLAAFINPDLSEQTKIKWLQISVFGIGAVGLFIALFMKGMFKTLSFAFSVYGAAIFVPVVFGLYWKKTTPIGAMTAMVCGSVLVSIGYFAKWTPGGFDPVVTAAIVAAISLVTVSLLTQPKKGQ